MLSPVQTMILGGVGPILETHLTISATVQVISQSHGAQVMKSTSLTFSLTVFAMVWRIDQYAVKRTL